MVAEEAWAEQADRADLPAPAARARPMAMMKSAKEETAAPAATAVPAAMAGAAPAAHLTQYINTGCFLLLILTALH